METSVSSKAPDEQLIIVLHIEEGIGFNAADEVLIQSSLSGNKLEAEPIKPGHTTLFDCNLVWETDRKSIKRMKTENLPVKIDCYALKNYHNVNDPYKEHIGYILVPVKIIPIVPLQKALQTKPRWIKLIGLSKDWRPHKPELLMNIMITTKDFLMCDKTDVLEAHGIESNDSIVIEENPIPCMLTSQRGIFIRLLQEEGLLQVGNIDTNCDVFLVKILMKNIRFVENLSIPGDDSSRDLHISYVLLGNPHVRALDKKFNRMYQLQEKVSINFRSSLASLQEYFETIFFIPLEMMSGDKTLGSAEIKLNQLIKTADLKEFLLKYPSSFCEMEGICTMKIAQELQLPNTNRPTMEYKIMIQYIATKKLHQTELLENYKRHQEIDSKAGGDHIEVPAIEKRKVLSDIPEIQSESNASHPVKAAGVGKEGQVNVILAPKTSATHSEKVDFESMLDGQVSELPRLFSCNLKLNSANFNRKPEKGIWQFSFCHDKADTPRIFINKDISDVGKIKDNAITFDDLEMKLYFTSRTDDIMDLIKSSDCTLCVKGPRGTHVKAQLDCKSLLIGNKEKMAGTILLQDKTDHVTAMASIYVYLEDLGVNFNSQLRTPIAQETLDACHSEMNVTRNMNEQKMLDENVTYKMIEELEEWKVNQQESFIADLKQKETQHLERLKFIWNEKQQKFEQELVMKADKLTTLTKTLQDAQSRLKDKDIRHSREEKDIQSVKQELEKSYNDQLLAIRERARRMEDDLLHEMKLKDIRFEDVQRCNEHMKTENCELRQRCECLQSQLNELKANMVPKEEVERLLQEMRLMKENLEAVQQSKIFYKEEWAKAFRECHKARRDNIADAKDEIFSAKFGRVCDVLDDDSFVLNFDMQELEDIKRRLNLTDDEL